MPASASAVRRQTARLKRASEIFWQKDLTERPAYGKIIERSNETGAILCRSGGIGRRPGLKIPWEKSRAGSTPVSGTIHRGIEQLVARRAHNPEAGGSSPPPATRTKPSDCKALWPQSLGFLYARRVACPCRTRAGIVGFRCGSGVFLVLRRPTLRPLQFNGRKKCLGKGNKVFGGHGEITVPVGQQGDFPLDKVAV